jgi:hypothetical protein
MEPRREEPKAPKPRTEEKPKRFRIVKLEERIAPAYHGTAGACHSKRGTLCGTLNCGTGTASIE